MTAPSMKSRGARPLAVAAAMLTAAPGVLAFLPSALGVATPGFQDFNFGPNPPAPTTKEPQSKRWLNDGLWWGGLYNGSIGKFHIHRLNPGAQACIDTGVVIDERDGARSDTLAAQTFGLTEDGVTARAG